MAEIGATLREARMRAGIDIAEVEARTKIRAKYLRALENEEWNLLPGPTFVKSFLKTYAEALGLDAKLLVEEYKFRHEPYEGGAAGAGPRRGGPRRPGSGGGGGGAFGPPKRAGALPLVPLVVVVGAIIYAVFALSQGERDATPPPTTTEQESAAEQLRREAREERAQRRERAERRERRRAAQIVKLRIAAGPTPVVACVVDATGRRVLDDREIQAGRSAGGLRSQRFLVAIRGAGATVTDAGRVRRLQAAADGVVAYRITKRQSARLEPSERPTCE
ncbi:helix-turn-helix domain-containing protein [Patulibacter brassicae]|uniref:Helix-turn-helix domain-containing protein n=1 Tax=Patulibacter brassicae TaxID=1705717 RepID=A0ABU4VFF0_9ACTN|nr:helix-turn-helix domain-containing protein [Patulibacter brassicae]MDX8150077.1 helix-turn-helix domain-containing protein [Patulibacter brassicae]